MKIKLWFKLAIVFLLVAFSTIVLAGGIINFSLNRQFEDYVKNNEKAKNERIVTSLESIYKEEGSWGNIKQHLMTLEMMTGRRVRITNNGRDVFDSKVDCMSQNGMGSNMMGRGMMRGKMQQDPGEVQPPISLPDSEETAKLPMRVDSELVGYAYITPLNQKGWWSTRDIIFRKTINSSIIIAGIIAGLVALLISFFISRRITYPVQRMTSVAQAMGKGDLAQRVDISSRDEIGVLGRQLNQLAAHLQKLESLRKKLTADVAHELRTPLTTVQSYIEAFQDGVMSVDQENLDSIHEEVIRLVDLVNDLQELSVAEGGKYDFEIETINLNKLIHSSVKNLSKLFMDKNINLNLELLDEAINLEFDKKALKKILHNLLSNAYKYTEKGGMVNLKAKKESNKVIIKVRDNGIGIPEKELPYIFERFYRVDESRARETGGTGIGLAIVKELVEAHGGEIEVISESGEGTEFIIFLPLKKV